MNGVDWRTLEFNPVRACSATSTTFLLQIKQSFFCVSVEFTVLENNDEGKGKSFAKLVK